ncbi:protein-lysine N-methyltransferase EEF2KMT-like [Patiria miniata]|uniref:FAM86 N-terminal domain-containing protein n=1 Tax=Patiria miniata TaxID=46514 RepID=A0A914ALU6_PATMI|nr:protein-lysine N-methyltransferase EEF2KMT-like [Patiria miniata]
MDDSLLATIHAQFLSMMSVRNFVWMVSDQFVVDVLQCVESQIQILKVTVKCDICNKYPPSLSYQQSFLKSLIQKCEASDSELADEIYETYTALLSTPQPEMQDCCYRTYIVSDESCTVTLKESVSMISLGTTGLNTWPAASYLTEWAMENQDIFSGRSVLELGSGMGLTGLAICKVCQPACYVFSDCHDSVLRGLRDNIDINVPDWDSREEPKKFPSEGLGASEEGKAKETVIAVECLDWEAVQDKAVQSWNSGVILAADVVYDTRIIEPLVHLLHMLLRCQGDGQGRPVAIVASTVRNKETYAAFREAVERCNILVEKIHGPKHKTLHYDRSCPIELLHLHVSTTHT